MPRVVVELMLSWFKKELHPTHDNFTCTCFYTSNKAIVSQTPQATRNEKKRKPKFLFKNYR
jgi:hypothetical protein